MDGISTSGSRGLRSNGSKNGQPTLGSLSLAQSASKRFGGRRRAELGQQSNGRSTARLVKSRKRGFYVFACDGGLSIPKQAE